MEDEELMLELTRISEELLTLEDALKEYKQRARYALDFGMLCDPGLWIEGEDDLEKVLNLIEKYLDVVSYLERVFLLNSGDEEK